MLEKREEEEGTVTRGEFRGIFVGFSAIVTFLFFVVRVLGLGLGF